MHPRVRVGMVARAALIFALIAAAMLIGSVRTRAGGSGFVDTAGHPFAADIEWLWESGITGGCAAGRYCPDAAVTREEMASFLVRAIHPPATTQDFFTDDAGSPHQADINRLGAASITGGCGSGRFCPGMAVTREQMASFLVRGFGLAATGDDYFWDDETSGHEADINRLAASGITGGCGGGRFCPGQVVTRGQMAAFLRRAIESPLAPPPTAGCTLFPATNVWNRRVDGLPVAADSSTLIATIGTSAPLHPDFGSYLGYGIPYNLVDSSTPRSPVTFDYADESDPGPYPIPANPQIEGGSDRHLLMWDTSACMLHELFAAEWTGSGWHAGSGAIWDLRSNALRPDGLTSADAAGLPILPGLVRYDEVAAGAIEHAVRFTAPQTRNAHVYPARHHAGAGSSASLPPMGLRVRLRAAFDMSGFSPRMQVILVAMQRYGMLLADNGSPWFFTGTSDVRWDDDELNQLKTLHGSDFEVVDTTGFVNG
ncbi:MAG: S-layer homology domain-containing protein [Candidatus Limnocylindria bacterium]